MSSHPFGKRCELFFGISGNLGPNYGKEDFRKVDILVGKKGRNMIRDVQYMRKATLVADLQIGATLLHLTLGMLAHGTHSSLVARAGILHTLGTRHS